ncbi:hypothetical protein TOT_020000216 [Theileria orientalis strain Shintoku]|uniref:Uncharacterized protein n=1 Tax=Theileria orientalis strain Shintoku TaxID=869250 RepID=J4D739_THEOR|nr:hypothetical protein TOT_020000216 [Theileria orientalis strain Shintoku]PVC53059.1 hypothetical protein MACL_00000328 [Theileria orientalis]BAM39945.1 hypothetical protein TOT_020000216 [Theileria orientalis strain Shintoku]|eukprot:XP_009690246.1 hypothetical protein TOT_020000216 [Theileria orientalis strain Shintoku]
MNSSDLDVDDRIESTGCKKEYDLLQECIDLYNRYRLHILQIHSLLHHQTTII